MTSSVADASSCRTVVESSKLVDGHRLISSHSLDNAHTAEPWHAGWTLVSPALGFSIITGSVGLILTVLWLRLHQLAKLVHRRDQQAQQLATTDRLTGLANRVELCRLGNQRLESIAGQSGVALLHLDIDRFQLINDTLGHDVGDRVLCQVGHRIKARTGPADVVARIGGDTFSLLISGDTGQAIQQADRLLEALRQPFYIQGHTVGISGSLGIATSGQSSSQFEADPTEFGQLLNQADIAMSWAKAERTDLPIGLLDQSSGLSRAAYTAGKMRLQAQYGESRYRVFEPQMQQDLRVRSRLQLALKQALVRQEFQLRYQPIIDLETNQTAGFEALVRWQHPEKGLVRPKDFLPTAESMGLMIAIDRWVLEAVCQQLADWRRGGGQPGQPSLSVNLSGVHLSEPELVDYIAQLLDRFAIPAKQLNLEVTESVLIANQRQAVKILRSLKSLGLRISLDDFGTGYSSLWYLHRLPVDLLKIDQAFIRSLGKTSGKTSGEASEKASEKARPRSNEVIVQTILSMAESLNLQVVAEGIEHPAQLQQLRQMRCRYGQGRLFSGAVTAQQAQALITQS